MLNVLSLELTYEVDRDIINWRKVDIVFYGQEDVALALALEFGSKLFG